MRDAITSCAIAAPTKRANRITIVTNVCRRIGAQANRGVGSAMPYPDGLVERHD